MPLLYLALSLKGTFSLSVSVAVFPLTCLVCKFEIKLNLKLFNVQIWNYKMRNTNVNFEKKSLKYLRKVYTLAGGCFSDDSIKQYFAELTWKPYLSVGRKPSLNHIISLNWNTNHSTVFCQYFDNITSILRKTATETHLMRFFYKTFNTTQCSIYNNHFLI